MAAVDLNRVREELYGRKQHILKNLESITMKQLRGELESALSLPAKALTAHKEYIADIVDQIIKGVVLSASTAGTSPAPKTAGKASPVKKKPRLSDEENIKPVIKARRAKPAAPKPAPAPTAPKPAPKTAAVKSAPKKPSGSASRMIEKLRDIAKQATVKFGPNVYKSRSEQDTADKMLAILVKQGLDASSSYGEIMAVKKRLALERDLEGIDTSNIIQERGRRRGGEVSYRQLARPPRHDGDSDASSEEEGSEGEGSDVEESDVEGEEEDAPAARRAGKASSSGRRKAVADSDEGSEGGDEGVESEEEQEAEGEESEEAEVDIDAVSEKEADHQPSSSTKPSPAPTKPSVKGKQEVKGGDRADEEVVGFQEPGGEKDVEVDDDDSPVAKAPAPAAAAKRRQVVMDDSDGDSW